MRKINAKFIKEPLSYIDIDKCIVKKLNNIGIVSIEKLCNTTRRKLNELGFSNEQINHITIKLQLIGLDLSIK